MVTVLTLWSFSVFLAVIGCAIKVVKGNGGIIGAVTGLGRYGNGRYGSEQGGGFADYLGDKFERRREQNAYRQEQIADLEKIQIAEMKSEQEVTENLEQLLRNLHDAREEQDRKVRVVMVREIYDALRKMIIEVRKLDRKFEPSIRGLMQQLVTVQKITNDQMIQVIDQKRKLFDVIKDHLKQAGKHCYTHNRTQVGRAVRGRNFMNSESILKKAILSVEGAVKSFSDLFGIEKALVAKLEQAQSVVEQQTQQGPPPRPNQPQSGQAPSFRRPQQGRTSPPQQQFRP